MKAKVSIKLQAHIITDYLFVNMISDLSIEPGCLLVGSYDRYCYSSFLEFETIASAQSALMKTMIKYNVIASVKDVIKAESVNHEYFFEDYIITISKANRNIRIRI